MNKDNQEFVNSLLQRLAKLNYIKPGDVPNIDLYMDQVTTFMDEHLSDVKRYEDDKILTKTMINNYTKNDLLPPPVKKKYSKEHIYVLTFIYYLKNILSISDIQKLLNPLTDKFFNKEELPDLEYIYSEIYNMEKAQIASLSKDVVERTQVAKEAFLDVENEEDKDFLQLFSLVGLLSFDVYMKKNIIESLIDLSATAKNRNGTAGKRTPAVAGSIFGELARRKSGTTHKAVTVIVALHKHGRTGRRILTRILPLQGQPSQTVVQIIHIGNVIQIGSARAVKHPESTDVVLHDLHRILHLIDLKNYPNIQNIAYLMLG